MSSFFRGLRPQAPTLPSFRLIVMLLAGAVLPVALYAATPPTTLYDGSGQPGEQGLVYFAQGAGVTQVASNVNTMADTGASAGFFAARTVPFSKGVLPVLDRQSGYTLAFAVRLNAEDHSGSDKNGDGVGDRAGFSVIVLSSDKKGIELGFWPDRVWAQNDGTAQPPPNTNTLFTHGEEGLWNTTVATTYQLAIQGDTYTLRTGSTTIVSGPLRDYTPFTGANDVYETPNFLFFGDDTGSAKADIDLTGPITVALGDTTPVTPTPVTPTPVTPTPVTPTPVTPTPVPDQEALYLPLVTR